MTPLAVAWSSDAAVLECADSNCGASDCKTDAAPCVCVKCGHFAKMLTATTFQGIPLRVAAPLNFFPRLRALPEGFAPSIDQPPRKS